MKHAGTVTRNTKPLIGIVIVAHGGLAREYLAAVEHVVGTQTGIHAITIHDADDRQKKQSEICAAADEVDGGNGVVVKPSDPVWCKFTHVDQAGEISRTRCRAGR